MLIKFALPRVFMGAMRVGPAPGYFVYPYSPYMAQKRTLNTLPKPNFIRRAYSLSLLPLINCCSSLFYCRWHLSLLLLGFANPQVGTKQDKVKRQGIDVMVAMDVSNSMLSEDIKPNRLARAKNFVSNFIDSLENDRLGLIVFAGRAYMPNAAYG